MVAYFVDRRESPERKWCNVLGPISAISDAVRSASLAHHGPTAELRLRGISTELQPDGTIVRRELTPDELAAAIRGEQVEQKPVKSVVVVDDGGQGEAVYIDGALWMATDLCEDDEIDASGLQAIAAGQPITIRFVILDRVVDEWPEDLASLGLDGQEAGKS